MRILILFIIAISGCAFYRDIEVSAKNPTIVRKPASADSNELKAVLQNLAQSPRQSDYRLLRIDLPQVDAQGKESIFHCHLLYLGGVNDALDDAQVVTLDPPAPEKAQEDKEYCDMEVEELTAELAKVNREIHHRQVEKPDSVLLLEKKQLTQLLIEKKDEQVFEDELHKFQPVSAKVSQKPIVEVEKKSEKPHGDG